MQETESAGPATMGIHKLFRWQMEKQLSNLISEPWIQNSVDIALAGYLSTGGNAVGNLPCLGQEIVPKKWSESSDSDGTDKIMVLGQIDKKTWLDEWLE